MEKTLLSLSLIIASTTLYAESMPSSFYVGQQSDIHNTDYGFTYPEITHSESEAFVNDVLFFYHKDMLDLFGGDKAALLDYVYDSVELNNNSLRRQDIPLRRKVAGLIRIPDSLQMRIEGEGTQKLDDLRGIYERSPYRFDEVYDASYVVGILPYNRDIETAVGRGYVGGRYAYLAPNDTDISRTLAHELGHNDGFTHTKEEYDAQNSNAFNFGPFGIGFICGEFSSIMQSGGGNRNEFFFSSPNVKNSSGDSCGSENEADVARGYKELLNGIYYNSINPMANNKPSREATGTVSLSLVNPVVAEGTEIIAEVTWSGAEIGDAIQLLTRQGTADLNDFRSTLATIYYDPENPVSSIELLTTDDDVFELDEELLVELVNPHGVSLGAQSKQSVILTSDELGNPGVVNFKTSTLTLEEGRSASVTLERTDGSDGRIVLNVTSSTGTAGEDDFTEVDKEIVFENGATTGSFTLSTTNDTENETAENFTLQLSGDSRVVGQADTVTVTIAASDAPSGNNDGDSKVSNRDSGGSIGIMSGLLLLLMAYRRRFSA